VWWNDPRLGASIGIRFDAGAARKYTDEMAGHYTRFADRLGDRLSPGRHALYDRFLQVMPTLLAQLRPREGGTIVHADAHVWNAFMPRDDKGRVVLFDWDAWRIGLGATDLAYMMAMHWFPDYRRAFERSLLDHYHDELMVHGVRGYDRRALEDDYRLAALVLIATPVRQAAHGIPLLIWWNNFERIMMAVGDLGCRDLLA
jgi:Ser/Thr protein kinase RdoA (MazF antagonist)